MEQELHPKMCSKIEMMYCSPKYIKLILHGTTSTTTGPAAPCQSQNSPPVCGESLEQKGAIQTSARLAEVCLLALMKKLYSSEYFKRGSLNDDSQLVIC